MNCDSGWKWGESALCCIEAVSSSDSFAPAMSDFPSLRYSKKDVLRAGEALKGELIWSEGRADEIYQIFRVANNWRESHAFPMRSIRSELTGKMLSLGLQGVTAARLKRMQSTREKLRKLPGKLDQIQDLGGCRIILPSIDDVDLIIDSLKRKSKHVLHNEKDYIREPKAGGYRCHHLIFKYFGRGDAEPFNGRRIEIQVRTRLQHSWATAVEAIGLVRREDMKGGVGDADWLRLFELMSAELAIAEKCPVPSHLPTREIRMAEIKRLADKLDAINELEKLRHVVRYTDKAYNERGRPTYYRIEFDNEMKTVNVSRHFKPIPGIKEYNKAEENDNITGGNKVNTVFVEADKVEDLKRAYPNYFGDVQVFTQNLKSLVQGGQAQEYTMPPQEAYQPRRREPADMTWFRPGRHRRWTE